MLHFLAGSLYRGRNVGECAAVRYQNRWKQSGQRPPVGSSPEFCSSGVTEGFGITLTSFSVDSK